MRRFHFYDKNTGRLHARAVVINVPEAELEQCVRANTPVGHEPIDGEHDHLSQRVDLITRKVVDWVPPAPSVDHVWNPLSKRWQLAEHARLLEERRVTARAQIAELEAKQPRAIREAALGHDGAVERLREIDRQISVLRAEL